MSSQLEKTIVFLGPSLSLLEAKKILPDACYMPPVQCGDILHVMRLKPKKIVIIDGYFEQCSAVWHKEILFAIEKGVMVLGASSMGALRAAELHDQGMIGVGEIYKHYLSGEYSEDDEVAVSHAIEKNNYQSSNVPLVNWRATLNNLLQKKLINQDEANSLFESAKSEFYPNRKLSVILEKAEKLSLKDNWKKYYVDQKKEDAILALHHVKNLLNKVSMPRTLFMRSLLKQFSAQAFPGFYHWLPYEEKVVAVSRLLDDNYRLTKRLAYLMATVPFESVNQELAVDQPTLLKFMKLSGDYTKYESIEGFKKHAPVKHAVLSHTALLWFVLEKKLIDCQYFPKPETAQRYLGVFCQQRGLTDECTLKAWLSKNDLTEKGYIELIDMLIRFDCFVIDNNDFDLNEYFSDEVFYLYEAMRVTGAYEKAEALLSNKSEFEDRLADVVKVYKSKGLPYLHSLDFYDEASFNLFVNQVCSFAKF